MGMLRRLFGKPETDSWQQDSREGLATPPVSKAPVWVLHDPATSAEVRGTVGEPRRGPQPDGVDRSWYVPNDGDDPARFIGNPPPVRLIPYGSGEEERILRLCEDSTGLLVGPTDRRLQKAGIWSVQVRGEHYHQSACRLGDFRPGVRVRLKREPENEFDPNAVAITADFDGAPVAGYFNKQKARALARVLDSGTVLEAVSVRGTGAGRVCEAIGVVAASPEAMQHMLSSRPSDLPEPAHVRWPDH